MKILANILYISYDGITDPLGQSQVLPYIEGLSRRGYRFTLVSCEKSDRYANGKSKIDEICSKSNIDWHPIRYHKSPPVFSTVWDISNLRKKCFQLHSKKPFDLVHCRSYIASLVGLEMKKSLGVKFIFDMRGFWADERVEGGVWNLKKPLYREVYKFFKRKEKQFLQYSDGVISLTEAGKNEILSWDVPGQSVFIEVIPCCADLDLFSYERINERKKKALRKELGVKENSFLIGYLGSIGTWYLLKEMLLFFKKLTLKKSNAYFLFVTYENPQTIINIAGELKIPEEKIIIRKANRAEVPDYLSLLHVGIFFIKPVFSKQASSPTKQAEMMGLGIPIICNNGIGDTGPLVTKLKAGEVIKEFSEQEFERVAERLEEICEIPRDQIRSGAKEYFSLNKGIEKYGQVYTRILS